MPHRYKGREIGAAEGRVIPHLNYEFRFFKGPFNARVVFDSGLQSCYCGQAIYSP